MAQRYNSDMNISQDPEVSDSSREQCNQLTFGFMTAKVERERERCKSESGRQLLDVFQTELITARQGTVHERSLSFPASAPTSLTSDEELLPNPESAPTESPPAERVGVVLGELGDVLEQHSYSLSVRTDQSPASSLTAPFFPAPTHVSFVEFRERIDEAVNRIVPPHQDGSLLSSPTVSEQPLPPLESGTFNNIARELLQVTAGNNMHPGNLAICLYFCYRLGVRILSQYLANRLGLGSALKDLIETCVQFLLEQQLLPMVQLQGGWGSYIEQWLQPSGQPITTSMAIGYVGVGVAIGFALGFLLRNLNP